MIHFHKPFKFNTNHPYPASFSVSVKDHLPRNVLLKVRLQKIAYWSLCTVIAAVALILNPLFAPLFGWPLPDNALSKSLAHSLLLSIVLGYLLTHRLERPQQRFLRIFPSSLLNVRLSQNELIKIVETCLPDVISKIPNVERITFLVENQNQQTRKTRVVIEFPEQTVPVHLEWSGLERWIWIDLQEEYRGPREHLHFEWNKTLNAHTKLRALARL